MGILSRFTAIMKANINELLDKAEDPQKMIDQTLRDLKEDLAEVKQETAGVMAEEKACKRRVDELTEEVQKYDSAARRAVAAGEDNDARTLIAKKQEVQGLLDTATNTYNVAAQNADRMKQMYNKLSSDIRLLESKRENIKAQVSMANAQEKINQVASTVDTQSKLDEFSRMEAKAQRMLDEAVAESELIQADDGGADDAAVLQAKYSGNTESVDDELAKMKAELGKE